MVMGDFDETHALRILNQRRSSTDSYKAIRGKGVNGIKSLHGDPYRYHIAVLPKLQ